MISNDDWQSALNEAIPKWVEDYKLLTEPPENSVSAEEFGKAIGLGRTQAKRKLDLLVESGKFDVFEVKIGRHITTYYRPKDESKRPKKPIPSGVRVIKENSDMPK